MFFNLRWLHGDHEHVERHEGPGVFESMGGDAFRVVSPVDLAFDIDRQEPGRYRIAGRVTSDLELACSRCLDQFRLPVAGEFDLRYVPRAEGLAVGERELGEDDLATALYDDEQIDLSQLILEQLQLVLPMKPLCSESCKGLCPQCGTNLNTSACTCRARWEDPRLAALKTLAGPGKTTH